MTRDLHPTDGARYLLERAEAPAGDGAGDKASYRVAIFTPEADYHAEAVLSADGGVELGTTGAPEALQARLLSIAKLIARDAAKLRADGMPAWPQRILRWRR